MLGATRGAPWDLGDIPIRWPGEPKRPETLQIPPGAAREPAAARLGASAPRRLTIGAANDAAEQEADALTELMFAGQNVRARRAAPPVARKCAACEAEEQGVVRRKCSACAEEEKVARRAAAPANDTFGGRSAPPSVSAVFAQPGRALDPGARALFERRLGIGLGGVRVHDDGAADRAARDIGAAAFTTGRHIGFAMGAYQPDSEPGLRLLAHELVHVAQNGGGEGPVRRSGCKHDGRDPGCGGGALARWNLVNILTQAVESIALDDKIVREGLQGRFGTNWVTQVTTPPNPVKFGTDRGRIDGARITGVGELKLEIVEVKSRSSMGGGCALATREAQGYVDVLKPLGPTIVGISAKLAPLGGLRVALGAKPKAADLLVLKTAGIDLSDKVFQQAWTFYNGLQNRLDRTFTSPFSGFKAELFAGGTPGEDYGVGLPVAVECTKKGKPGIKSRQLKFQVNGKGGVSYRCDDTGCQTKDEEEKREVQKKPVDKPVTQPQDQPQSQPQNKKPDMPGDDKKPDEKPDDPWVTNPVVLTGAGAGAVLTAAGIALARRRAKKIAAERIAKEVLERAAAKAAREQAERAAARNVINLAERRAANKVVEEGLERGGARVAGKVAEKAIIYAEVATIVLVLASGKAEAKPGFGPSAFEALYDIMRQKGHEPSPEMKALIQSDPVLKQLAEQAGAGGDPTPLQEEATKRMMELVRDNPGEFTAEELEILRQASNAGAGRGAPKTAAELRAAIDHAAAMQGQSSSPQGDPATATPGAAGPGAGPGGPGAAPVSSGDLPGQVAATEKKYPSLSPGMAAEVAAAPPPVRGLLDAMAGQGAGIAIDDNVVAQFLASVPIDLSAAEKDKLVAGLKPVAGESADDVIARLAAAVSAARSPKQAKPGGDKAPAGGAQAGAPDKAKADDKPPLPAADKSGKDQGSGQGGKTDGEADPDAEERVIKTLRKAIDDYSGWDAISPGNMVWVGEFKHPVGADIGIFGYAKSSDGKVRGVVFVQVKITRAAAQSGEKWTGKVISATPVVGDNGRRIDFPNKTISGTLQ